MVATKEFEVDDLVWAKMKGFSMWPARIAVPPTEAKSPGKKAQHYVFFFGSENYAWIMDENIVPHSEDMLDKCPKKKSAVFQSAIDRILKESATFTKKPKPQNDDIPMEVAKIQSPVKTPRPVIKPKVTKSPLMSLDVKKSISKSHRKPDSPAKTLKRRFEDSDADKNHSSPKLKKRAENSTGGTGLVKSIAIIKPFDDDIAVSAPSILARDDYTNANVTPEFDLNKVSLTMQQKKIVPTEKKIGFLGLGLIGRCLVKNLLSSGHSVMVWNRTPKKCEPFLEAGALKGLTPADVITTCDITFSCVSDPEASKTLVFGQWGILKGLEGCASGTKGYIELSSIDPMTSAEIEEAITYKGGRFLEAPMIGSRKHAEDGSMLILGSGDRTLFNECGSCFYAIASNAYYLSCEVGNGSKMSLILSCMFGTAYAALAEAMALCERLKLNIAIFLEIMSMINDDTNLLIEKARAMHQRRFTTDTALKHQQKDINFTLLLGNSCEQPMVIASAANEMYKHAKLLRYADHDVAALLCGAKF